MIARRENLTEIWELTHIFFDKSKLLERGGRKARGLRFYTMTASYRKELEKFNVKGYLYIFIMPFIC